MPPRVDPAVLERLRAGIEAMPLNRLLGLRVVHAAGGAGRAVLGASKTLNNHGGGLHAAAQYALVDAASGAAAASAFLDLLGTAMPLVQRVDVSFRRPATGACAAEARVDPDEAERARDLAASGRDAAFSVVCEVRDATGQTTLTAVGRWVLTVPARS